MSNIFTRKNYDPIEMKNAEIYNNNFNSHVLDINSFENKQQCVNQYTHGLNQVSKPLNSEGFVNFEYKTDIENKLRNQHLELNSQRRTNNDYTQVSRNDINTCETFNNKVLNENSRFNNPIGNFREMSPLNRGLQFTPYLFVNPQNVHSDNQDKMSPVGRGGVSTRYEAKNDLYVKTNSEYKRLVTEREAEKKKFQDWINNTSNLLPKKK